MIFNVRRFPRTPQFTLMPIIVVRILSFLWRYRYLTLSIGAIFAAKNFLPAEAANQAMSTMNSFKWLIVACFALYAVAQVFNWMSTRNDRK